MVVKTFMDMDQDSEEEKELYLNLALHLASDFFLKHPDKDVRLLVACCLADIFRIYAPEAPYTSPDKLKVRWLIYCSGTLNKILQNDITLLHQDYSLFELHYPVASSLKYIHLILTNRFVFSFANCFVEVGLKVRIIWLETWLHSHGLLDRHKLTFSNKLCFSNDYICVCRAFTMCVSFFLQDIFMFITRQLKGLEDTKSAQFNRYFYLLEVCDGVCVWISVRFGVWSHFIKSGFVSPC